MCAWSNSTEFIGWVRCVNPPSNNAETVIIRMIDRTRLMASTRDGGFSTHSTTDSLTLTDSLSGFGINGTLGAVGAIGVNKSINSTFSKLPAYEYGGVLPVSAGVNLGYQFKVYDPNRKNK